MGACNISITSELVDKIEGHCIDGEPMRWAADRLINAALDVAEREPRSLDVLRKRSMIDAVARHMHRLSVAEVGAMFVEITKGKL